MKFLIKKILIIILSLFTLIQLINAITIANGWSGIFYASLILMALNLLLRPILTIIFLPLNLVTFNLSSLIIEILIFYLFTVITPVVKIGDWQFQSYHFNEIQMIIISALVLMLITKFYKWLI